MTAMAKVAHIGQAAAQDGCRTPLRSELVITRLLATGGMAELFVADKLGPVGFVKEVVVKRLLRHYADDPKVLAMFLTEARIGAALSHPHLVEVHDLEHDETGWFIVMEHIRGQTLSMIAKRGLEAQRFLPAAYTVKILSMVCEGLAYLHEKPDELGRPLRIVHQDISPSNILVTHGGTPKIIDFGVAHWEKERPSADGLVVGKAHYMAPEQLRGERTDARADLWSVGVLLWELTLGRRLFKGKHEEVRRRVLSEPIAPPSFLRADYPKALEQIVMRALEKDPKDRYSTAFEMMNDLEAYLLGSAGLVHPTEIAQYLRELAAQHQAASPDEVRAAAEFALEPEAVPGQMVQEELVFERPTPCAAAAPLNDGAGDNTSK